MRFAPLAYVLTLLASTTAIGTSQAAWNSNGNVASDILNQPEKPTSITRIAGGTVIAYSFGTNNDSIRVNKLLGTTGARAWGNSGVLVNVGGNARSGAAVASDSSGGAWALWLDERAGANGLYVQRFNASGVPQLASGGLRVYHRLAQQFAIATSSAGELLIAFITPGDSVIVQRVSQAGVEEFAGDGALLATLSSSFGFGLDIHADGEGCVAVYGRFESSASSVWANRVSSAGAVQWGAQGSKVSAAGSPNSIAHRSSWDGSSLFVSWLAADATFNFVEPLPIRAQKMNGTGVRQWAANGVLVFTPVSGSPFYEHFFSSGDHTLAADGAGGCTMAWLDTRHWHQPAPNSFKHFDDIYGQRVGAAGTIQWAANGAVLDSLNGGLDDLRGTTDGAGGLLLAYTDHIIATGDEDVRLRRVLSTGTSPWVQFLNSILFTEDPSVDRNPVIASDGRGGAFVAWEDNRNESSTQPDVYAAHRTGTGSVFMPQITLTSPNGGERFTNLDLMPIRWTSNFEGQIRVQLTRVAGAYLDVVFGGTTNDGAFDWSVSDDQVSSTCRILVSDFDTGAPIDSSNAFFTICDAADQNVLLTLGGLQRDGIAEDFNEDGILDVAVTRFAGVSVQLGGGSGGVWSGTFLPVTTVSLLEAHQLAAADLDSDGILDLAVTHPAGSTPGVSMLKGNGAGGVGNGTFASPVMLFPTVQNPRGLAIHDLNGDGILDMAVALRDTNRVQILLGNGSGGVGSGTFSTGQSLVTNPIPERVGIADLSNDGVPDLVATCKSGVVQVWERGTFVAPFPTGQLTFPSTDSMGDSTLALVVEDFNEDGILDLAAGNAHSTNGAADGLTVRLGQSTPLAPYFLGPATFYGAGFGKALAATDMNGDGVVDLVPVSALAIHGFFGNGTDGAVGDGTFTEGGTSPGPLDPVDVSIADFNQDGIPDLLAISGSNSANNSRVVLGGCASLAQTDLATTSPLPGKALFIDSEGTAAWSEGKGIGTVDVELSRDGGHTWRPLSGHHPGDSFGFPVTEPGTTAARLRVRDHLNPGRTDATDAIFSICRAFSPGVVLPVGGSSANSLALADLNRDGHQDALTGGSLLRWRLGNGDGTFGAEQSSATNFIVGIAVADFDDDGILDVAGGTGVTGGRVFKGGNNGSGQWNGTFAQLTTLPKSTFEVEVADFNEDGIEDLATRSVNTTVPDSIYVYLGQGTNGQGTGLFSAPASFPMGILSTDIDVADFNGDGILDIAGVAQGFAGAPDFGLTLLTGQGTGGHGTGSFAPSVRTFPGFGMSAMAVADLTGDGRPDILASTVAGSPVDSLVVFRNQIGGSFVRDTRFPIPDQATDIDLADINGDGRLDVLASCYLADSVVVLLQRGAGLPHVSALARHQTFATSPQPVDLEVTDLDQDGDRDVVILEGVGLNLRVLLGTCGPLPDRSITIGSPSGGESWAVGEDRTLTWTGAGSRASAIPGGPTHVDVELSRNGGIAWQTLATGLQNQSFVWTVTGPGTAQARVRVRDSDGGLVADTSAAFTVLSSTVGADAPVAVMKAELSAPWPNPSRGTATFALALPARDRVRIEVFDPAGRLVHRIADRDFDAGHHRLTWDGRSGNGTPVGAGLYFVRALGTGLAVERKFVRLQ